MSIILCRLECLGEFNKIRNEINGINIRKENKDIFLLIK